MNRAETPLLQSSRNALTSVEPKRPIGKVRKRVFLYAFYTFQAPGAGPDCRGATPKRPYFTFPVPARTVPLLLIFTFFGKSPQ
jgi:hypothetical protein